MSANLLAELDSFYITSQNGQSTPKSPGPNLNSYIKNKSNPSESHEPNVSIHDQSSSDLVVSAQGVFIGKVSPDTIKGDIDDEDFGDFETAETAKIDAFITNDCSRPRPRWNENAGQTNPDWNWSEETTKQKSNEALSWHEVTAQTITTSDRQRETLRPKNLDILFDADEELEDHLAGVHPRDDFEVLEPVPTLLTAESQPQHLTTNHDISEPPLIDFDADESKSSTSKPGKQLQLIDQRRLSPSSSAKRIEAQNNDFSSENLGRPFKSQRNLSNKSHRRLSTGNESSSKSTQDAPSPSRKHADDRLQHNTHTSSRQSDQFGEEAEEWDDFEETTPHPSVQPGAGYTLKTAIAHSCTTSTIGHNPTLKLPQLLSLEEPPQSSTPPTNIPPPALLLSLFPRIIKLTKDELLEPLATYSNDAASRDSIISQPTTLLFLSSYISIARVFAYILAGRKLRWKRDNLLSQSMRIGPASSGGSRGMKLTSIDKGENAKEEREASEAVRLWRAHVGRLRTVVKTAGHNMSIPEITETVLVKLLPESEGGIAAPKPCALCGLKRNERVAKVDTTNVQDSFGEFWVEHWGHNNCFQFWEFYRHRLQ